MKFELRQLSVESKRPTFQNLVDRFGDKPASRYQEGTIDVQPREHFHYRPLWGPENEIYGDHFSKLKLTDPYSFLDPRQFYYYPYVSSRADLHDKFARTLDYLEDRQLLAKLPDEWRKLLVRLLLPLRHYEAAGQLLNSAATRFANGTSIAQCASFAAFDRIGNAQILSKLGLSLTEDGACLAEAKQAWLEDEALQPLRELVEHLLVEKDWGVGLVVLALVDAQLYPLMYRHLDDAALLGGAGAYSLVAQHLANWYEDQQKWWTALVEAWLEDPELGSDNRAELDRIEQEWLPKATKAVMAIAAEIDVVVPDVNAESTEKVGSTLDELFGVGADSD